MKRPRRISLLHLTSLLLLAALLTLWVRSYWRADGLFHIQPGAKVNPKLVAAGGK